MTPIINYLKTETLPTNEKEAKRLKREAQYYTIINNTLYKRGISIPLLKCVLTSNTREVLEEVHSGICEHKLSQKKYSGQDFIGQLYKRRPQSL